MALPTLLTDFDAYAPRFLQVKDPARACMVPFRLKTVQQKISDAIDRQLTAGRPARVQVLKFRRGGVSTVVAGRFFHRVVTVPYQRCQVIAHRGPDARTIFSIYERMYEGLPPLVRPHRIGGRNQELVFPGLQGSIEVGSAQSLGLGRGGDLQLAHLSEAAFFPDPENFLRALMPQLPASGNNIAVLESTSDGAGTWWSDLWDRSQDGVSGWEPIFFAWHEDPWNRLTDPLDPEILTAEERELQSTYGVDLHQLAWLRYVLETQCSGDVNARRREFPSCVQDCWVSVGRALWTYETLMACYERRPPIWVGELTEAGLQDDPGGRLDIWEEPEARATYVIGCDVASEVDDGTADLTVASIWRAGRKPGEWPIQVAEWHGNTDIHSLAVLLTMLGKRYNTALLSVEINGLGRGLQNLLQRFHYPHLYRYRRMDAMKLTGDAWGWLTSETIKDAMLAITDWLLRCHRVNIRSPRLIQELLNFRQKSNGVYAGNPTDDHIFAAMIAWTSWVQDVYAGTPMKDLRAMLARIWGAPSDVETVEARRPTWVPAPTDAETDATRATRRPRRILQETEW